MAKFEKGKPRHANAGRRPGSRNKSTIAREAILALGGRLAKGEISVELHDGLINGLRAFLGDKAAEQKRRLAELEENLRSSGIVQ
jgi:hypothetical protein